MVKGLAVYCTWVDLLRQRSLSIPPGLLKLSYASVFLPEAYEEPMNQTVSRLYYGQNMHFRFPPAAIYIHKKYIFDPVGVTGDAAPLPHAARHPP